MSKDVEENIKQIVIAREYSIGQDDARGRNIKRR
jgi:hypothetical protein